jgi:hypothetical protein
MGARDFMPFITGSGGPRVRQAPLTASATFLEGELVVVVDAGTLSEMPQDDDQILIGDFDSGLLGGVAAMDGHTTRTDRTARSTGDMISYYPINDGTLFITENFVATGDPDTAVIPAGTDVGESYQVTGVNGDGSWAIEQTAGAMGVNMCAIVHQVLNARKEPIGATDTTTGKWVVFELQLSLGTVT